MVTRQPYCDKPHCDLPGTELVPVEVNGRRRHWTLLCGRHYLFPSDARPGSQIPSVEERYPVNLYSSEGG